MFRCVAVAVRVVVSARAGLGWGGGGPEARGGGGRRGEDEGGNPGKGREGRRREHRARTNDVHSPRTKTTAVSPNRRAKSIDLQLKLLSIYGGLQNRSRGQPRAVHPSQTTTRGLSIHYSWPAVVNWSTRSGPCGLRKKHCQNAKCALTHLCIPARIRHPPDSLRPTVICSQLA